jgi:hypothetical protein
MKKVFSRSLVLALGVALVASAAYAKQRTGPGAYANYDRQNAYTGTNTNDGNDLSGLSASAAATTTTLYQANFGAKNGPIFDPCTESSPFPNGAGAWTKLDVTGQIGNFIHVDDYTSLPATFGNNPQHPFPGPVPISGSKGLWCGARVDPAGPLCVYLALPGYGNGWNQALCTKACISTSAGADGDHIDYSFKAIFNSEPGYDASQIEYTLDCGGATGWTKMEGGLNTWDDAMPVGTQTAYYAGHSASYDASTDAGWVTDGPVRVRLRFQADTAWSDEDALWNTDGAFHVDDLQVEALTTEGFETPIQTGANYDINNPNVVETTDWKACTPAGYGQFLAVYRGFPYVYQEDLCRSDLSCVWAAISNTDPNCSQAGYWAVPRFNINNGLYLSNETVSPMFSISYNGATGAVINFKYTAYRDEPLDNLIFYTWGVRGLDGVNCPQNWVDRNFVYYGDQKDWAVLTNPVGDILDLSKGQMQVKFGVIDLCQYWCPGGANVGTGACQTGAPYLDNVLVYRVAEFGPQWTIRDLAQFQDTFAETAGSIASAPPGSAVGKARADAAQDVSPGTHIGSNIPGDSSSVTVADRLSGLGLDATDHAGAAAVYMYVAVWRYDHNGTGVPGSGGTQPARPVGAAFQAPETRQVVDGPLITRYPVLGTTVIGGTTWTCIQLDSAYTQGTWVQDAFCVDLKDDLFLPGDTICFFYCATNTDPITTYAFGSALANTGTDVNVAAANASEFTILPAGGWARGGDILYVDGMDGRGAQNAFDIAFQDMGITNLVDRYDVRAPSSGVSNRPSGRVKDVATQLNCYLKIIWDTGDLETNIGDGTGNPEKVDDYLLLRLFLDQLPLSPGYGGLYLSGDDIAEQMAGAAGAEAALFNSANNYMPFTLISTNLWQSTGIVTSTGTPVGGLCYSDSFWIYGGCPLINDFDVMQASGGSVSEVTYNASNGSNDAVLSRQRANPLGTTVGVVLSGFSFIYIRSNDTNLEDDRARFLHDTLLWLGNSLPLPTPVGSKNVYSLSQNYPNPFNPQTTIAFSVKDRANVSLKVYNVAGELVRTLADESMSAGPHTKVWDGRNDAGQPVSSGVYFYKLVSNNFQQTKKMVLLK